MVVIVNALTTPQRYGLNLNHQNFLLFFFRQKCIFLFFPVWWYLERVYFFRFSGFMLPAFYCVCLRPVLLLFVPVWFVPSGCFGGCPAVCGDNRGIYIQILLQVYQRQAGFGFVWRGILSGHFIGAFTGAFYRGI